MKFRQRFIRIFISSTFSDMMQEREHLMKIIFPELRRRCKSRFLEITEVDLRWGIPEEDTKEGKVIEICLSEIDKSRPYFIGILGNRYGWVPSAAEYVKHQKIVESFPWTKDDIENGLSITEMEIQYGVLRNPNMDGRAFFYLKEAAGDLNEAEPAVSKLNALKERLKQQETFPVRNYGSIESLGKSILEDLWNQIQQDYPAEEIPDDHGREKLNHWGFLQSHTHFYKDYDLKIKNIQSELAEKGKVVLFGEKGQGKSAVLANLINETPASKEVAFFFCGTSPKSSSLEFMASFIAEEIKRRFDIEYQIPKKVENPGDLLGAFLNAVPEEKELLIVLDGIEQLNADEANSRLQWVPGALPRNVSLLLSTSSANHCEILHKQQFAKVELKAISPEAIKNIAISYLDFYSKKLPGELLDNISGFPLAGKPIVLFTLLNELRIFGLHEQLSAHVDYYTAAKTTDHFFAAFLQRLEQDFTGKDFKLSSVLTSIRLARHGLTENEILNINQVSRLRWSQIYNVLDYQIINKGGVLSFNNPYIEQAIQHKYITNDQELQTHLNPLLSYFYDRFKLLSVKSDNEELPRLMEELPDLAARSNNMGLLKAVFTFMPAVMHLFEKRGEAVPSFLSLLKGEIELHEAFTDAINDFLRQSEDGPERIKACFVAGHLLGMHDDPRHAIPFFNLVLELFNQSRTRSVFVFEALKELSIIYSQLGYADASAYILENLLPFQQDEDIADSLDLLGQQYKNAGKFEIAEILFQDAIAFYSDRFGGKSVRLAIQYNNLGRMYDVQKNFELAEKNYRLASEIVFDALGPEHSLYQQIQSNIGILYMSNQKLDEAEVVFEKVLGIRKALYGDQHRLTLKTMNSLGVCKSLRGDTAAALGILTLVAQKQQDLLGESHNDTLITLSNMADCYQKSGDLANAEAMLKRVLETSIRQYGEVHEQTINTGMGLADVLSEAGKTSEAIDVYRFVIKNQLAFYGEKHPIVGLTKYKLAALNLANNSWTDEDISNYIKWSLYKASQSSKEKNLRAAEEKYLDVLHVITTHLNGNHPAIFEVWDNLAGIYHHTRDYDKAAGFCRKIADMAVQAYGEGHPNVLEYQTLTAFNLFKNGSYPEAFDILSVTGQYHEELMNFKKPFVSNMYREMLAYFNQIGEKVELSQKEQDKVSQLFDQAQAFTNQAITYYQNGENQKAHALLDKANEIGEHLNENYAVPFIRAWQFKADMLDEAEDFENAINTLIQGIQHFTKWNSEFDPRTFFLFKTAGDIFMKMENFEAANQYLAQADKVNQRADVYPNEETVSLNISKIMMLLSEQNIDKALELIEENIELAEKIDGDQQETIIWLNEIKNEIQN